MEEAEEVEEVVEVGVAVAVRLIVVAADSGEGEGELSGDEEDAVFQKTVGTARPSFLSIPGVDRRLVTHTRGVVVAEKDLSSLLGAVCTVWEEEEEEGGEADEFRMTDSAILC